MIARLCVTALFVVLGGLVFVGHRALVGTLSVAPWSAGPTKLPGGEAAEQGLLREAERRGLHLRDPIVRDRLVRNMRFVETHAEPGGEEASAEPRDQALFERAIALGMHRSDAVARARLLTRTTDLLLAEAPPERASDGQLEDYLSRHPERFARAGAVTFHQVRVRGKERALAMLAELRGRGPQAAKGEGEPSLLPARVRDTPARVARRFGEGFARELASLEVGSWQGPVRSSFGLHLVYIEGRVPSRQTVLDEVREAVRVEARHDELQARRRALQHGQSEPLAAAGEEL